MTRLPLNQISSLLMTLGPRAFPLIGSHVMGSTPSTVVLVIAKVLSALSVLPNSVSIAELGVDYLATKIGAKTTDIVSLLSRLCASCSIDLPDQSSPADVINAVFQLAQTVDFSNQEIVSDVRVCPQCSYAMVV